MYEENQYIPRRDTVLSLENMFHVHEHALSQYDHPVTYISYWYVNITDSVLHAVGLIGKVTQHCSNCLSVCVPRKMYLKWMENHLKSHAKARKKTGRIGALLGHLIASDLVIF